MVKKIILYFIFVLLFVIGKYVFMLYYSDVFGAYTAWQWVQVLYFGLPHDLTSAGYLMALPFLLQIVFVWWRGTWHRRFMRFWIGLCLFLVIFNYYSDLILYGYWGFRLDRTALFYLFDSPLDALGQAPWYMLCLFPVFIFLTWWPLKHILCRFYPERRNGSSLVLGSRTERSRNTFLAVLCCGLLFVAIRGGVTTSTMNVGRVYFSSEMPLNHAATNPFFSFMSSVFKKQKDFGKQYRFMPAEEAAAAVQEMNTPGVLSADSVSGSPESGMLPRRLLRTNRPNVVLLILESFSGAACTGVSADANPAIMPAVNRLYQEGIGFTNFFGNSFRTDRGVAAIMASYPGQPTNSVMKDQNRCNRLDYFSQAMKEEGYSLHFVHGGDVNFTNMKGFLTAAGFTDITGDTDFPVSERLSKWGVPDGKMFDYLYDEIVADTARFLKVMLTLSSHEPFDVPFRHFENPYVNSVAYADSCLGSFVNRLKETPAWDNLLIIGVADHAFGNYPAGIQNHEIMRYRIPMFWTGGAMAASGTCPTYGSQTDLGATLLNQLEIGHDQLKFSKDLMDSTIGHYGFYAFSDGFGFVTDSIRYIQDNARNGQALSGSYDPDGLAERWGKAYLQTLYDDLSKR
ncbi:MAG: LTA synthase family protein [Bacteroidales bacterium]|nr:LTA synthase family protein [Bacteroidales bacterium]